MFVFKNITSRNQNFICAQSLTGGNSIESPSLDLVIIPILLLSHLKNSANFLAIEYIYYANSHVGDIIKLYIFYYYFLYISLIII